MTKLAESFQSTFAAADVQFNGSRPWDIQVHHPDFYKRVLHNGSLGLGESYVEGWWDCPSIDELFDRGLRAALHEKLTGGRLRALAVSLLTRLKNFQSKQRAAEAVRTHYDLGNDLYEAMLDSRMIYSCGYWRNATTLDAAQEAKLDLTCRKLQLKPGMSVLDIGCGWGGFAKYAAERYGVSVVGITLSQEQYNLAQERCKNLPIEIRLQDYRDLSPKQKFDHIVSIGMFEHVGYKNYKTFMHVASNCLKHNGLMLLHTIGRKISTTFTDPWIHKYIFPNSMLPSAKQISDAIEKFFLIEDWHSFGADYDKTLMAWYKNFQSNWHKLKEKYGQEFHRMWSYYLLSCAGTFRARDNQLWQIVLSKNGVTGGYHSIR